MSKSKVIVVSELYFPEENATGFILTKIAEGLATWFPVSVVCGQPNYFARGIRAPRHEIHNKVYIRRCKSTTFNKNNIFLRLINSVTISVSILSNLLSQCKSGDLVLVVTNPPLLPFFALLACKIKKATCILLIHDVYPEALIVTDILSTDGLLSKSLSVLTSFLYRGVDKIIVLGRDMHELVLKKLHGHSEKIVIIPNWADVDTVQPADRASNKLLHQLNLLDKFVVLYVGNMGRTHGLESLVESAKALSQENIYFLFIGDGAKKNWVEDYKRQNDLKNIIVLPPRPRSEQSIFLNACDIAIISFIPGMSGISVPSRMYNIMAAGKPILAVADKDSELARVVIEEQLGVVVQPGDSVALMQAILDLARNKTQLNEMGRRASVVVNAKYSFNHSIQQYKKVVESLLSEK